MVKRILVVEDYEDTREMFKVMLESQGYEVLQVDNGFDAVEIALKALPDIILMDMSLPGLDGCQATRRIRAQPDTKGIPIIACSAHNQWEWRAKALLAGCTEFVRKPVDFASLNSLLTRVLPPSASP
ncbi:MAG: two-component system, cell cycle response regulator DivK [Blastocatellia bacterium]|nr:two-component system, cell cycle response regulator DivK [Blastocatellia bacterium]